MTAQQKRRNRQVVGAKGGPGLWPMPAGCARVRSITMITVLVTTVTVSFTYFSHHRHRFRPSGDVADDQLAERFVFLLAF